MSSPEDGRSFAEGLAWLLEMVPVVPGREARFSTDDLVRVLSRAVPDDTDAAGHSSRAARDWLDAIRAENAPVPPLDSRSQRYVAALESLFRLPPGYFRDASIARVVDERIVFAHGGAGSGMRFIGPCRTMASEWSPTDLHRLHVLVAERLGRGRTAS